MLTLAQPSARPYFLPATSSSLTSRAVFAVVGTVLIALAAHVSIPLPFSPVPLTLQPFAVILIGMMLDPATAFATMLLYLGEGAVGLPVFSPLGPGGVAQLLGPTGGYLLSYPLAAATASWLVRSLRVFGSPLVRSLLAATAATTLIFLCGATQLATLLHLSPAMAMHLGVLPFLPGEAVKIIAAAILYRAFVLRPQA